MSAITLEQAEARLQDYLNAEAKVLAGLVVEMNGRRLTLANLAEIQRGIDIWNQRVTVARIEARRRGRAVNVAPRF
jgi:acyl-CoA reductase-like NAD-dependent aldehyde dehydrogenase